MRITKKITSLFLALCMILSVTAVGVVQTAADTNDATVETYAQETVNGSVILHCFDWSYNNIKAALPDIAKAGYTAVQTSPVQAPKDYNAFWTDTPNQWWKLYQPLGLTIADGNTWLGTKAELKALCTEAEKYGIKVIVDIVANHLANNGSSGGTYSRLNSGVESDLKNSAYIHSENPSSGSARYNTTQINIGMPDLNTGNSYIQQKVLSLLKDCVDCGVDGFRLDAAKHIEVPADDSSFKSNFWPYVINGINEYKSGLYNYGEILNTADIDISNYTQYMSVTDNLTGDRALDKAYWSAASELADSSYKMGAGASKSVLWVESHDTYMGNSGSAYFSNTQSVTSDVLINAWAIVGARADSTALYFARPNSTMGAASSDTTWKSTEVAEVNKFKNHFDGTSEYLSSSGNTAYIERGTKGVVISKLDGSGSVNLTAHAMKSGTYTDQITGNTFTVSGGKISGT
ncbi:MAG: alpha-amylase, partial [Ruminococcus sp.]|nr:alpha-amylase [Ruminococcus sp.]